MSVGESTSVACTVVTAVVFSGTDTVAVSPPPFDVITGASFTGLMVRLSVATLLSSEPSLALKLKLSLPLKSAAGV